MNALARWTRFSFLLLSLTTVTSFSGLAQAESRTQKTMEPKFFAGCPVLWTDGSRGIIVERQEYRDDQWFYLVRLGGEDGLCWSLPEGGLKFNKNAP